MASTGAVPSPTGIFSQGLRSPEHLVQALADPEHVFTEAVLTAAVVQAMRQVPRAEVRDMPDRIVAATALYSMCQSSAVTGAFWQPD